MAAACVYARPPDWETDSAAVGTRPKSEQETSEREWAGKETQDIDSNSLNVTSENQASSGPVSNKAPEKSSKLNIDPAGEQLKDSQLEKDNSGQNNSAINRDDAENTTTGGQLTGPSVRKPDVAQNGLRPLSDAGITDDLEENDVIDSSDNREPSASKLPAKFSSGISHPQYSESDQKPHQGAATSDSQDLEPPKSPEQSISQEPEATNGLPKAPEDPSNPTPAEGERTDPRNSSGSSAVFNTPSAIPSAPVPVPTDHVSRSGSKEHVTQLKKRFGQSSSLPSPTLSTNPPATTGHSNINQEALQQNSQSVSSASNLDQPSSKPSEDSKPVVSHLITAPTHQPPIRTPAYTGWGGVNLDDPPPLGPAGFFPSRATMGPQPKI